MTVGSLERPRATSLARACGPSRGPHPGRRLAPVVYDLLKDRPCSEWRVPVRRAAVRRSRSRARIPGGVPSKPVSWRRSAAVQRGALVEIIPQVGSAACRSTGAADVTDFFAIFGGMEGGKFAGVCPPSGAPTRRFDELAAVNERGLSGLIADPDPSSPRPTAIALPEPALPRHHPRHGPLGRGGPGISRRMWGHV